MKDNFFEWLNKCPTTWMLTGDNSEARSYYFQDNDEEEETD